MASLKKTKEQYKGMLYFILKFRKSFWKINHRTEEERELISAINSDLSAITVKLKSLLGKRIQNLIMDELHSETNEKVWK